MRWLCLCLSMVLLLLLFPSRILIRCFDDVDNCGAFEPEARSERTGELLEEGDDIQDRIVNGYKVTKMRPWMVRIGKVKKTKIHTFCGGAIVGTYFVLTAAHCFCDSYSQGLPDEVDCAVESIGRSKLLTGDMAGKYVVFVGSLRIKATWANAIQVDKVIAHSKMRLVEPWSYDVALMRTVAPMGPSESVIPICLPDQNTPEMFETVYAAGWGALRAKVIKTDACSTTQFGPEKFKTCKGSERGKKFPCKKEPNPNAPVCDELLSATEIDAQIDVARVDGTDCYLPRHNTYGWCHVKEETNEGGGADNWGFCFKACQYKVRQGGNKNLREVSLDVLDNEKCNRRRGTIDTDRELCIGRVLPKPIVGVYERDSEEGFRLKEISKKGNYDFVGYQDACQGDSGGPYYLYEKDAKGRRRGVIIGVVSRGNGCADKNEPGKATRVKHFVKWIRETMASEAPEQQLAKTPNLPPPIPPPPTHMSSSPLIETSMPAQAPAPLSPVSPPFMSLSPSNRYLAQSQPMPPMMVSPTSQYQGAILGSFPANFPPSDNPRTDHLSAQHRLKTPDHQPGGVSHQSVSLSSLSAPFQSPFFPPLVPSAPLLHYLGGESGILPTYGLQLMGSAHMSPALGGGFSNNRFGNSIGNSNVPGLVSPVSILLIGRSGKDEVYDEEEDEGGKDGLGGLTSRTAIVKSSDEPAMETLSSSEEMDREETEPLANKSLAHKFLNTLLIKYFPRILL